MLAIGSSRLAHASYQQAANHFDFQEIVLEKTRKPWSHGPRGVRIIKALSGLLAQANRKPLISAKWAALVKDA